MRQIFYHILAASVVSVLIMGSMAGCSKKEQPMTKAEFTKAVVDHALALNCKIMVQSIVMIEQGMRREDGALPIKIRYSCLDLPVKNNAGTVQPGHAEREEIVEFIKITDSAGKHVWAVR